MDKRPIGILDSGIGGLVYAKAIRKLLPKERIIFFGDTKHLPYGDKSPEVIEGFVLKIGAFLMEKECKLIVIACNSASSVAYESLKEACGDTPVINVIDPIIHKIISQNKYKKVGVIGTKATVSSDVFKRKFLALAPDIKIKQLATPLLAPMIEEGFISNKISNTIISNYLADKRIQDIEALILACTHYPLIKQDIKAYYQGEVKVLDSVKVVAEKVEKILRDNDGLNRASKKDTPKDAFYVSDLTSSFKKTASLFFGDKISLKKVDLWLKTISDRKKQ